MRINQLRKHSKKGYTILCMLAIVVTFGGKVVAQCATKVSHSSGTLLVAGSNVTVTGAGQADIFNTYCPAVTSPYIIGYSFGGGGSGPGNFLFNFSPPISGVTLNFSGASASVSDIEEIRLTVNGAHYAMSSPGVNNACDAMAVLTGAGDLRGCNGCGVSGWSGTNINGAISSLVVEDFVVAGTPNGALFSLFICSPVLPVEWVDVHATALPTGKVLLEWTTATEINNDYFVVERAKEGAWEPIGQVRAVGNATTESDYTFEDAHPVGVRPAYRIRQVNLDGQGATSEVVSVSLEGTARFALYPNPSHGLAQITLPSEAAASVVFTNAIGSQMPVTFQQSGNGGQVDLSELAPGIYIVHVRQAGLAWKEKLVLE